MTRRMDDVPPMKIPLSNSNYFTKAVNFDAELSGTETDLTQNYSYHFDDK